MGTQGVTNKAAERLRAEIGVAYRIDLLDDALAYERRATVDRIRAAVEAVERVEALSPLVYVVTEKGSAVSRAKVIAILDAESKRAEA